MRRLKRSHQLLIDNESDPLSGMANLFDLSMVFAVALMVAMVTYCNMSEFLTQDNVTMVKNPGKKNMEIIMKKGKTITKYKATASQGKGKGRRVGVAYELENGEIIYVPE